MVICPRYHLFEWHDLDWFPQFLREKIQDDLALFWRVRVPILQKTCPAQLAASALTETLGNRASDYTYTDFCSGAGGPTPLIEKYVNQQLRQRQSPGPPVQFLLTDLHPNIEAWEKVTQKSTNLSYVSFPVDATNAPPSLLENIHLRDGQTKLLRLFSLSFHHFDDDLAIKILENTLETADGIAIFELQHRDALNFIAMILAGPLLMLLAPFYFYNSPVHLFFIYLCPILPLVVFFDGVVSSLRTRTPQEVHHLLQIAAERVANRRGIVDDNRTGGEKLLSDWKFTSGSVMHTPPIGKMSWIICLKEES